MKGHAAIIRAMRRNAEVRQLLLDIAEEVRDPDGAGSLPSDLMVRIDRALEEAK